MATSGPQLILTRGLPGSGKSTWAAREVSQRDDLVRVNRDDLRYEMYQKYRLSGAQEKEISKVQQARVREALASGKSVVVDDTNLNPSAVSGWHGIAKEFDGKVQMKFKDFPTDKNECIRRDAVRRSRGERATGSDVINRMSTQWMRGKSDLPHLSRSVREPIPVAPAKEDRPHAVIFDVDGTLCDVRTVRHHVRNRPRNFHAFHMDSAYCPPNQHVAAMAQDCRDNNMKVVVITARDEKYKELTRRWLDANNIPYDDLITRPYGDQRPDYETKKDIFASVSKYYNIVHAVDDNPAVLQLWKEEGIRVTVVPGFVEGEVPEEGMIPIDNPIMGGKCLRCGKKMNRDGVLGPECEKMS